MGPMGPARPMPGALLSPSALVPSVPGGRGPFCKLAPTLQAGYESEKHLSAHASFHDVWHMRAWDTKRHLRPWPHVDGQPRPSDFVGCLWERHTEFRCQSPAIPVQLQS